jgi:hypothetical protein
VLISSYSVHRNRNGGAASESVHKSHLQQLTETCARIGRHQVSESVSSDGNVFGHHAGNGGKSPFTARASCIDSQRRSLLTLAPGGHVVVVRKVNERDGLI